MNYEDFLKAAQVDQGLRPGSIKDIYLRESRLITEIAYGFQEVVSPGRDVIFSFYVPANTIKIQFLKINIYFPGFQQGDYPLNSNILYLPYATKGSPYYRNGAFLSFDGSPQPEVGNGADGTYYLWKRLFTKFLVSSIRGFKLTVCQLKWLLSSKSTVGSGANTHVPLRLHAIADYGVMDKDDWGTTAVIDYGDVNAYTDTDGVVYSKDVMTRIQSLIDSAENYAAFRFMATTENTDKDNANNYHLDEPVLYCEIEEDASAKVGLYANDGKGFGDMLVSFNQNQEDIELQKYFSGVGKKQIKLSASRSRRVEVLVRMAIKMTG
jgi:hypothetical protein